VLLPALALGLLAGCAKRGDISASGEGIIQIRSACPIVAVAANTGDVTLFDPADARTVEAVDVTAAISNVHASCQTQGDQIVSQATFLVVGLRRDPGPARQLDLPYFSAVVRGGTQVVAKRIGTVHLRFDAGQLRAGAWATAASTVDKSAATLPPEIERMILKPRKSGSADAASDPLARPEVKAAVERSSFELLVGFNLTQDQLRYNITR
jgi:hypothetical protein